MQLIYNRSEFNNLIISYLKEIFLYPFDNDVVIREEDQEWLYFLDMLKKSGLKPRIVGIDFKDPNVRLDAKRLRKSLGTKDKITLIS